MTKNKGGENSEFFYSNFFPKNKKGQFFLIISVIIIGLIAGLSTITNSVQKQSDAKFYRVSEELKFESEKVIDYGIGLGFDEIDMKNLLKDFAEDYSSYSNADDFYYIFGTTNEITFAGCKKKTAGEANIEDTSGTVLLTLNLGSGCNSPLDSNAESNPPTNIVLKIDDVKYPFTLHEGQNFFFVVSKEIDGNIYAVTNG